MRSPPEHPTNPLSDWLPHSTTRSTYNIISTCLSTLIICVWSAVHVDIPTRKQGLIRRNAERLQWMVIGTLMPDWLLYLAIAQLLNAIHILKVAYECIPDLPEPPNTLFFILIGLGKNEQVCLVVSAFIGPSVHASHPRSPHGRRSS